MSMSDELKPGDLVRLKSGGPLMTVRTGPNGAREPSVGCTWYDERERDYVEDDFPAVVLEKAEQDTGSDGVPVPSSQPTATRAGF